MESPNYQDKSVYQKSLTPLASSLKSSVQMATEKEGEIPADFQCNICIGLVYSPVECKECQQIFCESCLDDWLRRGNQNCPRCQAKLLKSQLNRILKKFLEQTKLKGCPNCDASEMTYEELLTHLQRQCAQVDVKCPLGCGESYQRGAWEHHFDQVCTNVKALCTQCEEPLPKNEIVSHNCLRDLKAKVQTLEKEMQSLRLTTEAVLKELKEIKSA